MQGNPVSWKVERLVAVLCGLMAALFLADESSGAPKEPPTLTVGHAFDEESFQRRVLEVFVKGVSDARVARMELVSARKLADFDSGLLDAVRKNQVDLAIVPFEVVARKSASFGVFTTPFLFENFRHLATVQKGNLGQQLLQDLRRTEVRGIGWWAGEFLAMAGDRPALDPGDLVKIRIAYRPKSIDGLTRATAVPELAKTVGALPVALPPASPEAPLPLASANLVETTPQQLLRADGTPRFVTLTRHLNTGYVVVASPAAWDKLAAQSQTALAGAFNRAYDIATEGLQRQEESLLRGMPSKAAVIALAPADRAQWREWTRVPDRERRIGPLIAQVRDYPVVLLVSTPAPEARISWNAWLEDGQGKDLAAFTIGQVSRINLDLGRLPYTHLLTSSPDPRIKAALASGEPLKLQVQPILLGSQLEAAPGQALKAALMTVSLKNAQTLATDDQKRQAHWDGKLSTRELAAALGVSEIAQWPVKASQEGCADVAFAVWDEAHAEPLDHIVVSFPVQTAGGPKVTCYGKAGSKEMAAGLETMLQLPREGRTVADAALHVFEYNDFGSMRSVAVLVHARRLAAARSQPASGDPGVYSWELVSPLSAYVSDPTELPRLISEAHQRLATQQQFPYEDVVGDLRTVLFAGKTPRDAEQGRQAAEALKDAVASGTPGRVLMRLVDEGGKFMYLPLGLLAAGATKPFTVKRFTVIQPLRGAAVAPASCIRSWYVARSRTLEGAAGPSYKLLLDAPGQLPSPAQLLTTHEAVAQYLATQPTGMQGEGFIMLAHHEAGKLRFSREDRPPPWIRSDYINRRFPPGSLGVLAACSTTGSGQQTSAIVNRLASQGMSSLVLSPFSIDLEYGVRFALAFERHVLQEAAKPSDATAVTLLERSAAEVATSLPAGAGLHDMSLEFQLVGDPDIRICIGQEN